MNSFSHYIPDLPFDPFQTLSLSSSSDRFGDKHGMIQPTYHVRGFWALE